MRVEAGDEFYSGNFLRIQQLCEFHRASRTVGVPFVGMVAAAMTLGEALRRIHGGGLLDACALSLDCLDELETVCASGKRAYAGAVTEAI